MLLEIRILYKLSAQIEMNKTLNLGHSFWIVGSSQISLRSCLGWLGEHYLSMQNSKQGKSLLQQATEPFSRGI